MNRPESPCRRCKKTKKCVVCGKPFPASGRKKYCSPQCRNVGNGKRKYQKSTRVKVPSASKPVPTPKDPVSVCPKDCNYLSRAGSLRTCDYLLITGTPRECVVRPGGCDKYESI